MTEATRAPSPAGEHDASPSKSTRAGSAYPFFFTWAAQEHAQGVRIARGAGARFWTSDGEEWLDLGAMAYQTSLGFAHPRMVAAIQRQAAELCVAHPTAVFDAKIEAAERLLALAPEGFTRVFFTLGGAEANEHAVKMARLVTGRYKLLSRYRSYHGATLGALSMTGDYRRAALEPGIVGAIHAMDCYCDRCPFGQTLGSCQVECARHIGEVLDLEGDRSVAAVVLEAVPGANGVLVPPPSYWPEVRAHCDRHGTLLIADEVLTGFGRTGPAFGFQHFDVVPDMITVGKALTAGYAPMGAVLVHDRVARYFDRNVLQTGLTHYGHPLGCAAAAEALAVYQDDDLFGVAARLGAVQGAMLRPLREVAGVMFVRSIGMLSAIELSADANWGAVEAAILRRNLHVHFRGSSRTVLVSPPLVIDEATLRAGLQALVEAVTEGLSAAR